MGRTWGRIIAGPGALSPHPSCTMGSDDVDRVEIAQDWTARLRRVIEHALEVREARDYPDAIFYDMRFSDFVGDQFGAVEKIYRSFDLPMSEEAARGMRAFIDDNPQGKHGAHQYTPEEFGVDPAKVRDEFQSYIERFGLQAG